MGRPDPNGCGAVAEAASSYLAAKDEHHRVGPQDHRNWLALVDRLRAAKRDGKDPDPADLAEFKTGGEATIWAPSAATAAKMRAAETALRAALTSAPTAAAHTPTAEALATAARVLVRELAHFQVCSAKAGAPASLVEAFRAMRKALRAGRQ